VKNLPKTMGGTFSASGFVRDFLIQSLLPLDKLYIPAAAPNAAKPGKMYPGAISLQSTRPPGSGALERNEAGESIPGFALEL
jgi:hypothetical protein